MSKDITRSPEMLLKEAKIKTLLSKLKKRKTVLKSLKTRLQNTKTQIDQVQRNVETKVFHKMQEVDNLRLEVIELAKEFSQSNNISDDDKEQLQIMVQDLLNEEDLFGSGFASYKEQRAEMEQGNFNFDENYRAKMNDVFQQFQVKPPEAEQRNIRKVFMGLSKRFHPDLAKNEKEAKEFHSIMQELNEAYQNNDIQTLLEMEQLYVSSTTNFETKAITLDILQKEINRLNRDLVFINSQIDRTSAEVKNLRASEMGQMLSSINKAEKEGEGFNSMEKELDNMIVLITKLKEGLIDSIKRDAISPLLMEFAQPNIDDALAEMGIPMDLLDDDAKGKMQDMFLKIQKGEMDPQEMMSELLGGGGGGMMDMFGGLFGDDEEDDEEDAFDNAKFPLESTVKIISNHKNPHLNRLNMKGWVGRIVDASYDNNDEIVYEIELDSLSMQKIPDSILAVLIEQDEDFQNYVVTEKELALTKNRDQPVQAFAMYRRLFHKHNWNYLQPKDAKRMQSILLQDEEKEDSENWASYLFYNLSFPFKAKLQGRVSEYRSVVTVTGIAGIDEKFGIIMKLSEQSKFETYPLLDMETTAKTSKNYTIVEDYLEWADQTL